MHAVQYCVMSGVGVGASGILSTSLAPRRGAVKALSAHTRHKIHQRIPLPRRRPQATMPVEILLSLVRETGKGSGY
jgi:hypothetical protein